MTVTLKVKYFDFKSITRSITLRTPITDVDIMMKYIRPMLDNTEAGGKKVRLLGISISNFVDESCKIKKYGSPPKELVIPKGVKDSRIQGFK
jgi:nucleotidyltransferase/DNA polymerase involved in DNA repair